MSSYETYVQQVKDEGLEPLTIEKWMVDTERWPASDSPAGDGTEPDPAEDSGDGTEPEPEDENPVQEAINEAAQALDGQDDGEEAEKNDGF